MKRCRSTSCIPSMLRSSTWERVIPVVETQACWVHTLPVPQSAFVLQATHFCAVALQCGVAPVQSLSLRQATHVLVAGSQTWPPVQAVPSEHGAAGGAAGVVHAAKVPATMIAASPQIGFFKKNGFCTSHELLRQEMGLPWAALRPRTQAITLRN